MTPPFDPKTNLKTTGPTPSWLSVIGGATGPQLRRLSPGAPLAVWHIRVEMKQWSPQPSDPPLTWNETYGKRQVLSATGSRSVAEIEIARRLRKAGWQAGWLDSFGRAPTDFQEWIVAPDELPAALRSALLEISLAMRSRTNSHPDIIGWRSGKLSDAIFIEYKGPNDRIRATQIAWLQAAFGMGISRDQFAIAQWRANR